MRPAAKALLLGMGLALGLGTTAGCKHPKKFPSGPTVDASVEPRPEPPLAGGPMSEADLRAAQEACTRWVAHVCDCAKQHPQHQSKCELVSGQPDAIRLAVNGLGAVTDGGPEPETLWQNVREIARACERGDGDFKCE